MSAPPLHFRKMNGLGNDFVVVDSRNGATALSHAQIARVADRTRGIGCDQFISIERHPTNSAQVAMRINNADGGEVEACGNAARCVGWIVMQETGADIVTIETTGGVLQASPGARPYYVTVDMGVPRFGWRDIPLARAVADTREVDLRLEGEPIPGARAASVVNVGNPHGILWVDDVEGFDLASFGPRLEHHPMFPERANISIAQIDGRDRITMRVWERGVGLTLACGTGACAATVCAARKDLTDRRVTVALPGGPLDIEWRQSDDHITMSGPIAFDFEGQLDPETLAWSSWHGGAA